MSHEHYRCFSIEWCNYSRLHPATKKYVDDLGFSAIPEAHLLLTVQMAQNLMLTTFTNDINPIWKTK